MVHSGLMKHIYSIEGQFIDEMDNGKSPFRPVILMRPIHFFYHLVWLPLLSPSTCRSPPVTVKDRLESSVLENQLNVTSDPEQNAFLI